MLGLHSPTIAKKTTAAVKHKTKAKKPKTVKFPAFGLDWSFAQLSAKQLHELGATFAVRYLSFTAAKNLTPTESHALASAGIKRVLVWETLANRALAGYTAGANDAIAAIAQAKDCGAPPDVVIFFAVDFDAAGPEVAEYFRGAGEQLHGRLGAYAGYTAISYLFEHNLISHAYQTYAWSSGRWHPRAELLQYSNGHEFFGQAVDLNHALSENCGWF